MQRGLGEAAPPKGVPPMSDYRGSPHERFAVVSPTRALHQDGSREQGRGTHP
ncbi:MAG: hypothetical protein F6J99_32060 [Moorea sp. SIO4G3]|nr:hypothetical protein [Moorena sp. SIO4G3]